MADPEIPRLSRREWLHLVSPPAVAVTLATGGRAAPGGPPDPDHARGARVYNIRDFGAAGDGRTLDTDAVQAAIDACHRDDGGTVLVPAGNFVIGTVELKSHVTLHLAAAGRLLGSGDGRHYRAVDAIPLHGDATLEDGHWALCFAVDAENVTVEGPGTIDGQGQQFLTLDRHAPPPAGLTGNRRPYSLLFYRCRNLVVRDLELVRSAYHAVRLIQSERVRLDGLRIHNRVARNNDGFHFISCRFVTVSNCLVQSQDDACALFGSCQFVTVTNCTFSTRWSVFRFGGGVAENITVSNCVLYEVFGCPIKLHAGPGSRFENLAFANLVLRDVTGPIHIGAGPYPPRAHADGPGPAAAPPAVVRHVSFSHLHGTVTTDPPQLPDVPFPSRYNPGERRSCITVHGVGDSLIENISFDDVHLVFGGGGTAADAARRDLPEIAGEYFALGPMPAYGFYARRARGLTLNNLRLELRTPDVRPAVILDQVTDAAVTGLAAAGDPAAESALRFRATKRVLVTAARLLSPAAVFLQLEGAENEGLVIDGGDLSRAAAPLAFTRGAGPAAVRLRP